ncbi:unnamed protein product [Amoebophrya sp. A25]|nr:unnamed protein product [Amoebophrya sp. A25]|eukprot:GSA25T00012510001.1
MTLCQDDELATPIRAYIGDVSGASKVAPSRATAVQATSSSATSSATEEEVAAPAAPEDPRFTLLRSVGEECISEAELKDLLGKKKEFVLYDGFEPSGRMHIAQGLMKSINVNKCTEAGGIFKFWVADWFGLMNNKMGGDLEKIQDVGRYLIEVWKATGMNMERVKFIWTSEAIEKNAKEYWLQMLDISRLSSLWRIKKCGQIMGRKDEESLSGAQILYPIMQCTDIFFLGADICQLGVDQRKVNMLAREYCALAGRSSKPIILSHHMLYGLFAGQEKMSKSNPDSAIFMEDSEEDVRRKITNAYCPSEPTQENLDKLEKLQKEQKEKAEKLAAEKASASSKKKQKKAAKGGAGEAVNPDALYDAAELEDDSMQLNFDVLKNPIIDYVEHVIFSDARAAPLTIKTSGTSASSGSVQSYTNAATVRDDFCAGKISEADLKAAVIERVNELLAGVREKFQKNPEARAQLELVEQHKKAVAAGGPVKQKLRCLVAAKASSSSSRSSSSSSSSSASPNAASGVVFLPNPNGTDINSCGLPTDVVLDTAATLKNAVKQLSTAPAQHPSTTNNKKIVLFVPDWSSFVLNKFNGDMGMQKRWFDLFLDCLQRFVPEAMASVEVMWQSEAILQDPNNYWISVIDVGRVYNLGNVRDMIPASEDFVASGQVVAGLMGVGDVLALSCASTSAPSRRKTTFFACNEAQQLALVAAQKYIVENIHTVDGVENKVSTVEVVSPPKSIGEQNLLRATIASDGPPVGEAGAKAGSLKLEVAVGDNAKKLDKKIKKLFCLAGEVEKNPVLDYLYRLKSLGLLANEGTETFFHVSRSGPEDVEKFGPEQKFATLEAVEEAFKKGEAELHPRDLKITGQNVIMSALGPLLGGSSADSSADSSSALPVDTVPQVLEDFAQKTFGKKK